MASIHPTAIVDPAARLGDDVEVGAYSVIESDVEIGAGTVLRPHAMVLRYTTMGTGNYVDSHAVLGGLPQDYKFDANPGGRDDFPRDRGGQDYVHRQRDVLHGGGTRRS